MAAPFPECRAEEDRCGCGEMNSKRGRGRMREREREREREADKLEKKKAMPGYKNDYIFHQLELYIPAGSKLFITHLG